MKMKAFSLVLLTVVGLVAAFAAESQTVSSETSAACTVAAKASCSKAASTNCNPEACPVNGPECPPCCTAKTAASTKAASACSAQKTAVHATKVKTTANAKKKTK